MVGEGRMTTFYIVWCRETLNFQETPLSSESKFVKHEDCNMSNPNTLYSCMSHRYLSLSHGKSIPNMDRDKRKVEGFQKFDLNGLSSIDFQLLETRQEKLFTHIKVQLPNHL